MLSDKLKSTTIGTGGGQSSAQNGDSVLDREVVSLEDMTTQTSSC